MNEYIQLVRQRNASFAAVGEKRYACVVTFGCQQNEADSEKLRGMADAMGYTVTEDVNIADLIVVNTCAVREHAEQRVFGNIGALKGLVEIGDKNDPAHAQCHAKARALLELLDK